MFFKICPKLVLTIFNFGGIINLSLIGQTTQNYKGEQNVRKFKSWKKITLKELRTLTGMTQEEFASYVEIPYTTYRRYELNLSTINATKLFQIFNKFSIPLDMYKF